MALEKGEPVHPKMRIQTLDTGLEMLSLFEALT